MINDAPIQDKMDSVTWSHWFASVASSISGEWYSSNAIPSVSGGLETPNNCYIYINPQSAIISAKFENGVSVGGVLNLAFSVFPSVLTLTDGVTFKQCLANGKQISIPQFVGNNVYLCGTMIIERRF